MTSRSVDTLAAELARLRREFDDFRATALGRFPSSDAVAAATGDYPVAHVGRTGGFQDISGDGSYVDFSTAQVLRGGMEFSSSQNSITVPISGTYLISVKGYFTGGAAYMGEASVLLNESSNPPDLSQRIVIALTSKPDGTDYTGHAAVLHALNAGDVLRMYAIGASSTWGSSGYDGSHFSVAYVGN